MSILTGKEIQKQIAKVNIIAETDVAKNTFLNVVNHIYQNWVCTLR